MSKWLAVVCSVVVLVASTQAVAAPADCRKDAEAILNRPDHRVVGVATFFEPEHPLGVKLTLKRACALASCQQVFFSTMEATNVTPPAGFVPDTEYAGPGGAPQWHTIPRAAGSKCDLLKVLKFRPAAQTEPATTGKTPPVGKKEENKKDDASKKSTPPKDGPDQLKADLESFKSSTGRAVLPQASVGVAQGLSDVAAETVQILGQIVVDRASAEAYRLLKERLLRLLQCNPDPAKSLPGAPALVTGVKPDGAWTPPLPKYPATCKVLKPLRLQDVATSRDLLFNAVATDAVAYLESVQASLPEKAKTAEEIGAAVVVTAAVVPLIIRPRILVDVEPARVVVGAILAHVKTLNEADLSAAQTALAAGVLAYVKCAKDAADNKTPLVNCDFASNADGYVGDNVAIRTASHSLAANLISVATLTSADGRVDARGRVIHAVDALFASACMLAQSPQEDPVFRCPAAPEKIESSGPTALQVLSLLQPVIDASLEGDANALVVALSQPLELFAAAKYKTTHQRAFLLLGSLLQYSATYAQQDANTPQMHEQRTKTLESLTKDMTDRTAREEDDIWSFGGSLRLQAGARFGFGGDRPAFFGPLGLPLGIGFDHVATDGACGLHMEFNPLDIGQYVSYDKQGIVKTPDLADAFTPSVTIGVGWGRSIPLILGATMGYSPALTTSATAEHRGTFNLGAVFGMYVPLIDMN